MAEDAAVRGWTKVDFARAAGVSDMTVIRFLRGDNQSPPTAARLAEALGYTAERYVIRSSNAA